ncbi:MAG TPA: alpha/beta hydrolase-fold protein [Acidobacteriaceae bacterium]|jgi:enterochelin esterase family protein
MIREIALASLLLAGLAVLTTQKLRAFQQQPVVPTRPASSHQVNPDGSITFRYKDGSAKKVSVSTDATFQPLPMTRGDDGVWTVTTPALPPSIYGYSFSVDGVLELDPRNLNVRHNLAAPVSEVTVPAEPPAPWELTDIAHGVVARHVFTTRVAKNLPQNQSAYFVYTPPGYDSKHSGGYPVLYLLHGFTDAEDGWTSVGRAHLILDSLIDSGKAVPMIVVMPLGYGNFSFLQGGFANWDNASAVDDNTTLFEQMLETEVMPAIERDYNTAKGRDNRAIAGLSMGGLESLTVGLNHTDQFAYIAAFSSAVQHEGFDQRISQLNAQKADLRLLWVACGVEDHLVDANRAFVTWARSKKLPITAVETPGEHTWLVWRNNLLHVAPLLFRRQQN